MSEPSPQETGPDRGLQRKATLAFAGFIGVGLLVSAIVGPVTGNMALGLLYGLLPGLALGLLARTRILNGRLVNRPSNSGKKDRETA